MPRPLNRSAAFALTLALCVTPARAQHAHGPSSPAAAGQGWLIHLP